MDSSLYKEDLPYEVIAKTRQFEASHETHIESFKIMAPKRFFTLEDRYKDPLLFAPIGNGFYYLIAKWGNDLSWKRKLTALPKRNIITVLASLGIIATLISFCLPAAVFHFYGIEDFRITTYRVGLSIHLLIFFSMISIYVAFAFHLYPSNVDWDSKHFN